MHRCLCVKGGYGSKNRLIMPEQIHTSLFMPFTFLSKGFFSFFFWNCLLFGQLIWCHIKCTLNPWLKNEKHSSLILSPSQLKLLEKKKEKKKGHMKCWKVAYKYGQHNWHENAVKIWHTQSTADYWDWKYTWDNGHPLAWMWTTPSKQLWAFVLLVWDLGEVGWVFFTICNDLRYAANWHSLSLVSTDLSDCLVYQYSLGMFRAKTTQCVWRSVCQYTASHPMLRQIRNNFIMRANSVQSVKSTTEATVPWTLGDGCPDTSPSPKQNNGNGKSRQKQQKTSREN